MTVSGMLMRDAYCIARTRAAGGHGGATLVGVKCLRQAAGLLPRMSMIDVGCGRGAYEFPSATIAAL